LNLAVIPEYGFTGAATVTLITEIFEAALLFALFRRVAKDRGVSRVVLVPVVAAGTMALVLWSTGLRDGGAVAVGAAVYALALVGAARVLAPGALERALTLVRRGRSGPGETPAADASRTSP
jgi:membrane associated rhomboid family serine protease